MEIENSEFKSEKSSNNNSSNNNKKKFLVKNKSNSDLKSIHLISRINKINGDIVSLNSEINNSKSRNKNNDNKNKEKSHYLNRYFDYYM